MLPMPSLYSRPTDQQLWDGTPRVDLFDGPLVIPKTEQA